MWLWEEASTMLPSPPSWLEGNVEYFYCDILLNKQKKGKVWMTAINHVYRLIFKNG